MTSAYSDKIRLPLETPTTREVFSESMTSPRVIKGLEGVCRVASGKFDFFSRLDLEGSLRNRNL